jgi:hypothetical protein
VALAGRKLGVPLWRLLIHDWSKFLPDEWGPYASFFYDGDPTPARRKAFDRAWLKHQHRQPHHWQHWILRLDDGATHELEIPEVFVREMVADWMGAGRAITGRWEVADWYDRQREKLVLERCTRDRVEHLIRTAQRTGMSPLYP